MKYVFARIILLCVSRLRLRWLMQPGLASRIFPKGKAC